MGCSASAPVSEAGQRDAAARAAQGAGCCGSFYWLLVWQVIWITISVTSMAGLVGPCSVLDQLNRECELPFHAGSFFPPVLGNLRLALIGLVLGLWLVGAAITRGALLRNVASAYVCSGGVHGGITSWCCNKKGQVGTWVADDIQQAVTGGGRFPYVLGMLRVFPKVMTILHLCALGLHCYTTFFTGLSLTFESCAHWDEYHWCHIDANSRECQDAREQSRCVEESEAPNRLNSLASPLPVVFLFELVSTILCLS